MSLWWTLAALVCGVLLGLGPAGIAMWLERGGRWLRRSDPRDRNVVPLTAERRAMLLDAKRRQDAER